MSPPKVALKHFALLLLPGLLGALASDTPHTPYTPGAKEDLLLQGTGMLKAEEMQHQLEEDQNQVDNDSSRWTQDTHSLPLVYHEENSSLRQPGNESIQPVEKVDKVTHNETSAPHFSGTLIRSSGRGNEISNECTVDKDCEGDHYCQNEVLHSKCLPCKGVQELCTSDAQCCGAQLCVWGQCTENATKGEPGSICQHQRDCGAKLCCAFHKALLPPVCMARPLEHQRCRSHPNHLMAMLSWDQQNEGPLEQCPCAPGLQCQPLGRGSLCLQQQSSSSEEDLMETLYSEIDYII
ncbi:dickkopf-related protein 3-like isoform X2 [Scleropages formosus]|nr:dickkopf-related protein 3-like isoform X2 [Scleropages formosus]XP_018620908.1 dickkopf-related protein 3-like isoform X2 [Scleropages formosus]